MTATQVKLANDLEPNVKAVGRRALAALGVLMLMAFLFGEVWNGVGEKSETKRAPAASKSGSSASASAGAGSSEAVSTETTITKEAPAEGVLLALLGTGTVLVLAGGFYTRLSAIKLPGGGEIDLTAEERKEVEDHVARAAAPDAAPAAVQESTQKALVLASALKTTQGELSGDAAEWAAAQATRDAAPAK